MAATGLRLLCACRKGLDRKLLSRLNGQHDFAHSYSSVSIRGAYLNESGVKRESGYRQANYNRDKKWTQKRTWNLPAGVQNILRDDVLTGSNFEETVFRTPFPVVHDEQQQYLVRTYCRMNLHEKKEMLHAMDEPSLLIFMEELLISKLQFTPNDHALLSDACRDRLKSANLIEKLRLTDLLFVSGSLNDTYIRLFLNMVSLRWPSPHMDTSKVLQLLFYIGVYRNAPPPLMDCIEQYLMGVAHNLTGTQIGLVCHAFFASNYAMKNFQLLETIARQTIESLDDTPLYLICNVMKAMHHAGYNKATFYDKIGTKLSESEKIASNKRMSTLSNIISSFASERHSHPELFEAVSNRAAEMVLKTHYTQRLKDLARIIWSCKNQQLPTSDVLVGELERQVREDETLRERYPQAFTEAVMALVMCEVYVFPQLSYVLGANHHQSLKKTNFEQHYQRLLLDNIVETECSNYRGNRLSQEYIADVSSPRESHRALALHTRQGLAAIWLTLEELFGEPGYVKCHYISNFTRLTDIELCIGSDGRPVIWCSTKGDEQLRKELKEKLSRSENRSETEEGILADLLREHNRNVTRKEAENLHLLPKNPSGTERRITVKVMSENQYVSNESVLLGVHQLEMRLLTSAGYEVLLINPSDAAKLEEAGHKERVRLVETLILRPLQISLNKV